MDEIRDAAPDRLGILNDPLNSTTAPRRTVTVRFGPSGDGPLGSASFTEADGTQVDVGDPVVLHGGQTPPQAIAALLVRGTSGRR